MAASDIAATQSSSAVDRPASTAGATVRGRSWLPRFGLRTALIVALVFCLLMGWVGRNAYRVRQEDAAIETLRQAGATIYIRSGDEVDYHPATPYSLEPPKWESLPSFPMRLLGLSGPAEVTSVRIHDDLPKGESLDAALTALALFPDVETIEFSGTAFDDKSLDSLTPLENLRELSVYSTKITGDRLARVPSLARLRRLWLSGLEPPLAPVLASMPELRDVQMYRMPASRADIEALASLPHLESLNLLQVRPTDEGAYAPLAKAQSLKRLLLFSSPVSDAETKALAKLTRLERLQIAGITDAGARELAPLTNLRWVEFRKPVSLAAAREYSATHERCVVTAWPPQGRQKYHLAGEEIDSRTAFDFDSSNSSADD